MRRLPSRLLLSKGPGAELAMRRGALVTEQYRSNTLESIESVIQTPPASISAGATWLWVGTRHRGAHGARIGGRLRNHWYRRQHGALGTRIRRRDRNCCSPDDGREELASSCFLAPRMSSVWAATGSARHISVRISVLFRRCCECAHDHSPLTRQSSRLVGPCDPWLQAPATTPTMWHSRSSGKESTVVRVPGFGNTGGSFT